MANLIFKVRIIQVMGASMFIDEVVNLMCLLYILRAKCHLLQVLLSSQAAK
jgi:hypothetical protein